jgi:Domain of unknown function (DUF4395)
MRHTLTSQTLHRLDVQGFDACQKQRLAEVAPWLRLTFGLCALLAGLGTAAASPILLVALAPIAALGAAFAVHPFDLIYNHGIRHLTGTGPLPTRGAPSRFACGMGAAWLLVTAWAFSAGHAVLGYVLGSMLTAMAVLVSTTDICIPSMVYRLLSGPPRPREAPARLPKAS